MEDVRMRRGNASPFTAAVVMVVISLVLFFIPLINGLVAGLVGGYMTGSVRRPSRESRVRGAPARAAGACAAWVAIRAARKISAPAASVRALNVFT